MKKQTVKVRHLNWFWTIYFWCSEQWNGFNQLRGKAIFGGLVIIREEYGDDLELQAHEMVHVLQYRREGIIKFTWNYMKEQRENGYRKNKYELEAWERQKKPEEVFKEFDIVYHKDWKGTRVQ